MFHESHRKLMGQRGDGELLVDAERVYNPIVRNSPHLDLPPRGSTVRRSKSCAGGRLSCRRRRIFLCRMWVSAAVHGNQSDWPDAPWPKGATETMRFLAFPCQHPPLARAQDRVVIAMKPKRISSGRHPYGTPVQTAQRALLAPCRKHLISFVHLERARRIERPTLTLARRQRVVSGKYPVVP